MNKLSICRSLASAAGAALLSVAAWGAPQVHAAEVARAEIQARIATATHSSLAIADELQTLSAKTTGVTSLPVS